MKKSRFIYSWLLFVCFFNVKYAEPAEAQVSAEDEFEDYLSSIEADFYNFEDSINRNFADYMEQAWQEFTVYEGTEPPVYAGGLFFTGTIETTLVHPRDSFFGSFLHFPYMVPGGNYRSVHGVYFQNQAILYRTVWKELSAAEGLQ